MKHETAVVKSKEQVAVQLDDSVSFRGISRRFERNWFLDRKADLAVVTDGPSNDFLGILQIQIQKPTAPQKAAGILAKVAMQSHTGWDFGITVWECKHNPGDIMLMPGGVREVPTNEMLPNGTRKKTKTVRDRRLSDRATAQILSYVWKHLQPTQV